MPHLIASVEGVEIKKISLQKDRTTLGRHPDNDIVFDNMVVSGHHCVFELKGLADVYIEDLNSTNGTYINGKMVKRQRLHDGEVIAIGNFRIKFNTSSVQSADFSGTTAMQLGPDGQAPLLKAFFKLVNGSSAGLEMPVLKAVSTFGKPGACVVAVSHRRDGFYVAHMDGDRATLNGERLGDKAVMLADHDLLEISGSQMLFLLKD
jgi:hypothetical protein